VALCQGCRTRPACRCRMAAGLVSCPVGNTRKPGCRSDAGEKKKPWECLPICHESCNKEDAGGQSVSNEPAGANPIDTTGNGQEKEAAHEPTKGRPESERGKKIRSKKSGPKGGHIQLELF